MTKVNINYQIQKQLVKTNLQSIKYQLQIGLNYNIKHSKPLTAFPLI